jgi:hypothetical protein
MMVTTDIFESHLSCKYKTYLFFVPSQDILFGFLVFFLRDEPFLIGSVKIGQLLAKGRRYLLLPDFSVWAATPGNKTSPKNQP